MYVADLLDAWLCVGVAVARARGDSPMYFAFPFTTATTTTMMTTTTTTTTTMTTMVKRPLSSSSNGFMLPALAMSGSAVVEVVVEVILLVELGSMDEVESSQVSNHGKKHDEVLSQYCSPQPMQHPFSSTPPTTPLVVAIPLVIETSLVVACAGVVVVLAVGVVDVVGGVDVVDSS